MIYLQLVREGLGRLPCSITSQSDSITINTSGLATLSWKGRKASIFAFRDLVGRMKGAKLDGDVITLDGKISLPDQKKNSGILRELTQLLMKENPMNHGLWGVCKSLRPNGFEEAKAKVSQDVLAELYKDDFIVKEKKAFILDLDRSQGSYMVSIAPENHVILDAAAQIASLNLGFNHPDKRSMVLHPEILDSELDLEKWEISKAFKALVQEESGLKNVYFTNSGSEALEAAYKVCQILHPKRRRIISFDGSFHGRTLLSLHTTHSPAKRQPFEIYKNIVTFLPFPEQKDPSKPAREPQGWLDEWSKGGKNADSFLRGADDLLKLEVDCLKKVRDEILRDPGNLPLCVVTEPIQCEGGDKFGSPRYFRALRALTKALDVPLVMDEVQAGLGLGGSFFWFQSFQLPSPPDVLCLAKKTQIGICATNVMMDLPTETSAASIYRGYLQARAAQFYDTKILEEKTLRYLNLLQKTLDPELIQNPRAKALAFAFDLPSEEILNALVAKRFENGTLFYPAGTKTARFRLMASTTDDELAQIFAAVYGCFVSLSKDGKIYQVPPLNEWQKASEVLHPASHGHGHSHGHHAPVSQREPFDSGLPWEEHILPTSKDAFLALGQSEWHQVFLSLAHALPQLKRSLITQRFSLGELAEMSAADLWALYERDPAITLLDILWLASRGLGFPIQVLSHDEVGELRPAIGRLQKSVYEPARQDDPEMFYRVSADRDAFILAMLDPQGEVAGFCATAPMKLFPNVEMVKTDRDFNNPRAYYAIDLTIANKWQHRGLGLRLKTEQYIEALRRGAMCLRSRNRYPEAVHMMRLNMKLGAVSIDRNDQMYGGSGTAYYQSIQLNAEARSEFNVYHPQLGMVLNKVSLGNFVSPQFVPNMRFIRSILPKRLRHVYLASGRAECVDKVVKALIAKRPGADVALSFKGDYFGSTTACSRSLGDKGGSSYFDWPVLSWGDLAELRSEVGRRDSKKILGIFVEPAGKKPDELKALIATGRELGIPVIFHETRSWLYQYSKDSLFCANEDIQPDGIYWYPGGQIGFVALTRELFLDKPLTMISTWDGDEFSLAQMRDRLLNFPQLKELS